MVGYYCCVPDCKRERYPGCGLAFHRLPQDAIMKQKWIDVIPAKVTKNTVICCLHFTKDDYVPFTTRKLKKEAVPSIFTAQIPPQVPASTVKSTVFTVETPASTVKAPTFTVEASESTVKAPAFTVEAPASTVKTPASTIKPAPPSLPVKKTLQPVVLIEPLPAHILKQPLKLVNDGSNLLMCSKNIENTPVPKQGTSKNELLLMKLLSHEKMKSNNRLQKLRALRQSQWKLEEKVARLENTITDLRNQLQSR